MVEVYNIVKRYGNKLAVNDISFSIKKGEIVGLLGSNGAGKSTTMNIITGYIAANEGKVLVNGFDVVKDSVKAKSQIGYLPEQPPLYEDMSVKGYLDFVYNLKNVKFNKFDHINEICEKVGITDVYDRTIKKLSKGYKQRVGVAQALIGYPPLIILDEPTVGLDPKQIVLIRNMIKNLAKEHTVIFSSHILPEVKMICDRIIVINSGKIAADKDTGDITQVISKNSSLVLHVDGNNETVAEVLKSIEGVVEVKTVKNIQDSTYEYIVEYDGQNDVRKTIFMKLASNNLPITKLDSVDTNLEDVFLKLTENDDIKEDVNTDEGSLVDKDLNTCDDNIEEPEHDKKDI